MPVPGGVAGGRRATARSSSTAASHPPSSSPRPRRGIAKLFPAHAVGPRFLRSVLAVAPPGARVVPTGGIALDDVRAWLDAGAYAVGMGSELAPSAENAARLRELRAEAVPA